MLVRAGSSGGVPHAPSRCAALVTIDQCPDLHTTQMACQSRVAPGIRVSLPLAQALRLEAWSEPNGLMERN